MLAFVVFVPYVALSEAPVYAAEKVIDCKAERAALYNETEFLLIPNATLDTKEDSDPHTFEFLMVKDLPRDQNHITEDGQAIYLTAGVKDDETKNRLALAAFNRRLELKLGTKGCQMQPKK